MKTFEQWCRSLGVKPQPIMPLMQMYRESCNIHRGVARSHGSYRER